MTTHNGKSEEIQLDEKDETPIEITQQALTEENEQLTQQSTASMSSRQKKLHEIKLKLNAARRLNAQSVQAEHVRFTSPEDEKKKLHNEHEKKSKKWKENTDAEGRTSENAYLYETAEKAEDRAEKNENKNTASFGWDVFNTDAQHNAYNKRLKQLNQNSDTNFRDANSLEFGSRPVGEHDIDRMVAELEASRQRKSQFSRRRAFNEDEDISYINERNRVFNKKIKRAYDKYTVEMAQNVERGSAL